MRSKIKEENPTAGFGDLTRLVSEAFKNLSPEERKKWDQRAEHEKARYKTEMASYQPPASDNDDRGPTKKKAKKDPMPPSVVRRPMCFIPKQCVIQSKRRIRKLIHLRLENIGCGLAKTDESRRKGEVQQNGRWGQAMIPEGNERVYETSN